MVAAGDVTRERLAQAPDGTDVVLDVTNAGRYGRTRLCPSSSRRSAATCWPRDHIRLSPALIQPVAAHDVALALADVALAPPFNGTVEVVGPESMPLDELRCRFVRTTQAAGKVMPDVHPRYFGGMLSDRTVTPGAGARIGAIRFATGSLTRRAGR